MDSKQTAAGYTAALRAHGYSHTESREQLQRVADACAKADRLLGEGRALEAQGTIQTALAILDLTFGFIGEEN